MNKNAVICNLFILFLPYLVLCSGIEQRQTSSSSIAIPTFKYGYYSDVYPTGAVTTKPTTVAASPTTVNSTSIAGSEEESGPSGPVEVNQEEAFIASMCQPINQTNDPDLDFPCNKIVPYEAPCLYGKKHEELLNISVNSSPATPVRSGKDQFQCFCAETGPGPLFWDNSVQYVAAIIS